MTPPTTAVAPMGERAEREALAEHARARLEASVDAVLGERYRPEPGTRPDPYDGGLVVSSFGLLERCARRAAVPAQDYVDTVATTRRRIGLAALRRLEDDASPAQDLPSAVTEVIEERTSLSRSLADWLEGLDRAGRAAVAASATAWASAVLRIVGRVPGTRWADASASPKVDLPDRLVRLTASHDAERGGLATGERLLLVADSSGGARDRLRVGYLALVRSLGRRQAPVRVTLLAPSRGERTAVVVDEALLSLAVDRVAEHLAALAQGEHAPASTGPWCSYCHLLELCDEGRARLASVTAPGA